MKRIALIAALLAAGALAALSLGVGRASAWSPTDLPPGWTISHELSNAQTCPEAWRIHTPSNADFSDPFCTDSPTYQQDFDAWVDARYTAPPPTTAATTVPPLTTTVVITTTTPADTNTTPASTDPNPNPPPAPAPQQPVTNTFTVTTTASPVEQSLQAQIDALSAQIAGLTNRVTRLEKASDAAWLAFQQAIANGDDVAAAAAIARGTAMNVIYHLGDFA